MQFLWYQNVTQFAPGLIQMQYQQEQSQQVETKVYLQKAHMEHQHMMDGKY